jgi:hypothetical protein
MAFTGGVKEVTTFSVVDLQADIRSLDVTNMNAEVFTSTVKSVPPD